MSMQNDKSISGNVIWRFLERFSAKAVTFIVSVVLARLLDPEVYGTVALVTVFTTILEVFIDSGLGNALIQKKDADDLDFSSVFYFNVAMCLTLYLAMYFAAPYIAAFYRNPELTAIVRVLSLTLIISGVKNIQHAYISRRMMFRTFFLATTVGTVASAIVGLAMAYGGFGVWALVAQPLLNYLIDTLVLWCTVKWRPKAAFSWTRLKGLLAYGWKLLVAKLLNTTYEKLRDLIVGKVYSETDLAFFNKGASFPGMIVPNITNSVDGVLFPAMAARQDDQQQVRMLVNKSISISSYMVFPMMAGLCACAEPLVRVLLTDKWLPCVPFLYIYCLVYAFWPLSIANLNSIRALGRSDILLKLEITERVFSLLLLLFTFRISVLALGISYLLGELFSSFIVMLPNKKLIGYGAFAQLRDLAPLMVCSGIMGAIVYAVQLLGLHPMITLLIQVPLGAAIYFVMSKLFHFYGYTYITDLLRRKLSTVLKRKGRNTPSQPD